MDYEENFNEKMLGAAKKEGAVAPQPLKTGPHPNHAKQPAESSPAGSDAASAQFSGPIAGMSWAGGVHHTPGGLSPELAHAAGVNGSTAPVTPPNTFRPITSSPRMTESHSGKHMNGSDIFRT